MKASTKSERRREVEQPDQLVGVVAVIRSPRSADRWPAPIGRAGRRDRRPATAGSAAALRRSAAAAARRRAVEPYLQEIAFICCLGVGDDLVEIVVGVVGRWSICSHGPCGELICSKNVSVYGVRPTASALATSWTSGSALKYWLSELGSVRVVRLSSLGVDLDLTLVRQQELHEATASSTRLLPFGMTTRSPPMNEAYLPASMPGSRLMPNSNGWSFIWSRASAMLKLPGAHHAELAGAELLGERRAGLGAGAVGDVAGLDHVARPLEHLLDAVADERLVAALAGLDRGAGRPHQRADGEDVAAGAVARQVVALDVAAERGDLVGVRRGSRRGWSAACSGRARPS